MLVILKESIQVLDYSVLAVNLNIFDEIIISNIDNRYQLTIIKHFDGHYSSHSTLYRLLDVFDSHKECLALFQKLVNALKDGKETFDLREDQHISNDTGAKDVKKQVSGFL